MLEGIYACAPEHITRSKKSSEHTSRVGILFAWHYLRWLHQAERVSWLFWVDSALSSRTSCLTRANCLLTIRLHELKQRIEVLRFLISRQTSPLQTSPWLVLQPSMLPLSGRTFVAAWCWVPHHTGKRLVALRSWDFLMHFKSMAQSSIKACYTS